MKKSLFLVLLGVFIFFVPPVLAQTVDLPVVVHNLDWLRSHGEDFDHDGIVGTPTREIHDLYGDPGPGDCGIGAFMAKAASDANTYDLPALKVVPVGEGTPVWTGLVPEESSGLGRMHYFYRQPVNSGYIYDSMLPPEEVIHHLNKYYQDRGVNVNITLTIVQYQNQWPALKFPLDNGSVYVMASRRANHYWVIKGYHEVGPNESISGRYLIASWGHDPYIRNLSWSWLLLNGPYYIWYVEILDQVPPVRELPSKQEVFTSFPGLQPWLIERDADITVVPLNP